MAGRAEFLRTLVARPGIGRAAVLGLAAACAALAVPGTALAQSGNVVMTVDGRPVHEWQLELAKRQLLTENQGGPVKDSRALLRGAVEQVIGQALLAETASSAGFSVTDAEVSASMAQQRAMAGNGKGLADALKAAGISDAELLAFERDRLVVGKYVEATIVPKNTVDGAELERYYKEHPAEFQHGDQVHLWMIMVAVPPNAAPDVEGRARERATKAWQRLQAGEDFAAVAKDLSDDPSKANGGLIGWVRRGMLLPELDPVVFALKPGDISSVVRSLRGYHVMRVDGHRGQGLYDLSEIRPQLENMLRGRKINEAVNAVVRERRERATIVAIDPSVKDVLADEKTAPRP